jgi:hypothetical protein
VLPIVALALLALLYWEGVSGGGWSLRPRDGPLPQPAAAMLLGSFFVLGGLPILEELLRTSCGLRHHQVEDDDERRERHDA